MFTNEELIIISNALLGAIRNASNAKSFVNSTSAIQAIERELNQLKDLNTKVCDMMD